MPSKRSKRSEGKDHYVEHSEEERNAINENEFLRNKQMGNAKNSAAPIELMWRFEGMRM